MDAVAIALKLYFSGDQSASAEGIYVRGLAARYGHLEHAVAMAATARLDPGKWWLPDGSLSFQKGLGAVHAISHPLGGMQEAAAATEPLTPS